MYIIMEHFFGYIMFGICSVHVQKEANFQFHDVQLLIYLRGHVFSSDVLLRAIVSFEVLVCLSLSLSLHCLYKHSF